MEDNNKPNVDIDTEKDDQITENVTDADEMQLPMIPLRGLSVFPNMVLHFDIGREKSINALEKAMVTNQHIFLASQKDDGTDLPTPEDFYHVGTVGKIKQMLKLPGDSIRVLVEGVCRGAIEDVMFEVPYFKCRIRKIEEPEYPADDAEAEALMRTVLSSFDEYINLNRNLAAEIFASVVTIEDPGRMADMIASHLGDFRPEVLLVLGSGLGFLGDRVEARTCVSYADIPHFRASTAPGHEGRFVFGELRGKRVAVMQGRMHCYEGYTMEDAAYACRVIRLLGAKTMIVTNAAGAVNTDYQAGDLMLISDHIKLFDFGPLWGPNIDEFGTRFPDMSSVYSPRLRELAKDVAREQDLTLREGVYMYFPGPQFETPAEVRAARVLGADAVGMSTVPEAIAAAHCGYEILGVTLCANMAAGVLPQPLSGEEVNEMAEQSAPHFSSLILGCLERL